MRRWWWAIPFGLVAWWWKTNQDQSNRVSLKNKVVILTGASAGIGRETARALAREGAHLLLVDIDAQGLAVVQDELTSEWVKVYTYSRDITEDFAAEDIVAMALDVFGRVDVLINNAGLVISGDMTTHSASAIRRLLEVNVFGVIRLCQAAVPVMLRQHSGHIVNVSSTASTMPSLGYVVYGASKGAVTTFSHALRREMAGTGVRVSYIAPGWINTQMIAHMHPEDMQKAGMISDLMQFGVQEPSAVAEGILDAVRYNRYEVIVGGQGFHLASWLHRLSPTFLDVVFRMSTNRKQLLDTAHRPD